MLYRLACDVLGVDHLAAVVEPGDETAASVGGRRAAGAGGQMARDVPLIASLPLVVFDDVDKMPAQVRQAFWPYLRGEVRQLTEGQTRRLRPVAAVTYNPRAGQDPDLLLPTGWARRSLLLDADYALAHRGELRQAVAGYYRPGNAGQRARDRLDLDALRPPAANLDGDGVAVLETVATMFVDPDRAWPSTGLELAALGRAALLGNDGPLRAAVATAVDYLMVASTVAGVVREDWPAYTAEIVRWEAQAGRRDIADLVAAYQSARSAQSSEARTRRLASQADSIDLVGARAELVAGLEQAELSIRNLPPACRARGKGTRAQLGELRRRAGNTKTAAALADIEALAAGPLGQAAYLRRAVDTEREQQRQQAATERAAADAARRQAIEQRRAAEQIRRATERQARAQASATLDQAVSVAKTLERMYGRTTTRPGENPLRELLAVPIPGGWRLLAYTPPAAEPPAAGPVRAVLRDLFVAPPDGRWSSTVDPRVSYPGTGSDCRALGQWGPASRAVLAPVLTHLHDTEDQLRAQLGRKPRARPAVAVALPPIGGLALAATPANRPAGRAASQSARPGAWAR